MNGFEGSFLGDSERLEPASILECGVCWWVYDPALGDETWQISPGTAFADLPGHWRCPNCDNPAGQFMVVGGAQPGAGERRPSHRAGVDAVRSREGELSRAYTAVGERMRALPVYNDKLDTQVIGLRRWTEGLLGIVATPWCMNIVLLPCADAARPMEGTIRELEFPSGRYPFIAGQLEGVGAVESCSLFSPMEEFDDPAVVRSVAEHALAGLFNSPEAGGNAPGVSRRRLLGGGGTRASDQPAR